MSKFYTSAAAVGSASVALGDYPSVSTFHLTLIWHRHCGSQSSVWFQAERFCEIPALITTGAARCISIICPLYNGHSYREKDVVLVSRSASELASICRMLELPNSVPTFRRAIATQQDGWTLACLKELMLLSKVGLESNL